MTVIGFGGHGTAVMGRVKDKRQLGRPRLRWENAIKMHLTKIGRRGAEWINLVHSIDYWRAALSAGMIFRLHNMQGAAGLAASLLGYGRGLCPAVLVT